MTPPPPRSTLFPYTTLFRSRGKSRPFQSANNPRALQKPSFRDGPRVHPGPRQTGPRTHPESSQRTHAPRSEEHTSELQSQFHIVCRLLLEKKKKEHLRRTCH